MLQEMRIVRSSGKVVSREGARFEIISGGKMVVALKAVSCLVEPEVTDVVAVLETSEGLFISDVLHRSEECQRNLTICFTDAEGNPQDVELKAGNLALNAEDKLTASGKQLGFQFKSILMTGDRIALVGQKLMTSMQEIVSHAKQFLATYDTMSTKAKNRIDRIVETDQLKAGAIQTQADTVSLTQAGSTLIVAREDVRMDGKRITMG